MIDFLTGTPWLQQVALVLAGLLIGFATERFLVRAFHTLAARTESTWDDLAVQAIHRMPVLWWTLAGGWAALLVRGADETVRQQAAQVMVVLLIASLTVVASRIASGSVDRMGSRSSTGLPTPSLVNNLAKLVVGTLGLFLILQNLGIQITPLITALGIGGLAVALALQDTLSNLFAGVTIILAGQIRPQDYVRLEGGPEGFVVDVQARNSTIRTFPSENLVIVPNSVLSAAIVTNYSLPKKNLWISIPVGVSYDSDLEAVERITIEVANETLQEIQDSNSAEPALMRYQTFGESSIDFDVLLSVTAFTDQFLIRHTFIKRLHARFGKEGIEIPFPIRTVVMQGDAGKGGPS